ncbi:MAG TPA: methionyl-tRNA formyltransferase [Stellaceae bacterium]
MDLIFMGTPAFAATILAALIAAGHHLRAAYTQPPRPAGRGHRLQPSPVQLLAERHGIAVYCPTRMRDPQTQEQLASLGADAAVVAAYGLILPPAMLAAPRLGCLNVHASLLPRWRGAAPVQRALLAGDSETGVTIMQMEAGLDTGPILMQQAVPISAQANAGALTEELAGLGGRLIVTALDALASGELTPRPQPQDGVTYAPKIGREEGRLDWRRPAGELERRVRALNPWPGAFFEHRGERLRVLAARTASDASSVQPGTVLDDRLSVACGSGVLRLSRLQRPGRAPLNAAELLRGYPIPPGTVLPCPATG